MTDEHLNLIDRYFQFAHLPQRLQEISRPFCELAESMCRGIEVHDNAELTVALRKLLEAKDAAVRAYLP